LARRTPSLPGLLLAAACLPLAAGHARAEVAPELQALLRRADVGSMAPPSFRAELVLRVTARPQGARIEVWRAPEERTLVRFLNPGERGKYLVYSASELFFVAPGARKPVKLPASFRIQGAATLDDILGRRYSRDYLIQSAERSEGASGPRVAFLLKPKAPGGPFASIRYVVDPATARPERAEGRLASGRLASVVLFLAWASGDRLVPSRLVLEDALHGGSTTEVELVELEEREVPPGLVDPRDGAARARLERGERP
jgi:hypothetical protein